MQNNKSFVGFNTDDSMGARARVLCTFVLHCELALLFSGYPALPIFSILLSPIVLDISWKAERRDLYLTLQRELRGQKKDAIAN